jgi:hypothetical protein
VATKCHEPVRDSRRRVKHGHLLRDFPVVAAAYAAGKINGAHLDLFASACNARSKESMTRDEALLVDQAVDMGFEDFTRSMAYYKQSADPDGTEEEALAQRERRCVSLIPLLDGTFVGRINLDPISGTIVADELGRLEKELFEADWAEAKERLGYEPKPADLGRTSSQRQADALVEMATRSRSAPMGSRRPMPLFSVFVDYPTIHGRLCELSNGTVVTPGSLLPWLDQALVERAVFQPDGRIEVSETARFFTGATRRALELRDRRCTHPFCQEPIERCQGDHIELASMNGPTTQANGRLLCAYHNRLRNQRPPPGD